MNLEQKPAVKAVKAFILSDDLGAQVVELLAILEPAYEVLRYADTRSYTAGDLYTDLYKLKASVSAACSQMDKVLTDEAISGMEVDEARTRITELVMESVDSRWDDICSNELHATAYLLHPCGPVSRFSDERLRRGFSMLITRWYPGQVDDQNTLNMQLDDFKHRRGEFSNEAALWAQANLVAARYMAPALWWGMYGWGHTALAKIAVKVLSQPITSSDCERVFSLFGNVQRKNRRRLTGDRMTDTVRVTFAMHAVAWAEEAANKRKTVTEQIATRRVDVAGGVLTNMRNAIANMRRGGSASTSAVNPASVTESTTGASDDASGSASASATAASTTTNVSSSSATGTDHVSPTACSHEGQGALDLFLTREREENFKEMEMRRSMKDLPYCFNVMNELRSIPFEDEMQADKVVGSGNAVARERDDLFDDSDDDANDVDYDPLDD